MLIIKCFKSELRIFLVILVMLSVCPALRSRVKYLVNYWMDWQKWKTVCSSSVWSLCHDLEFVSHFVSCFEVFVSSVSLWLSALVLIVSFCVIAGPALIVFTCVSFPVVQSPPPACVCKPCSSHSRCGFELFGPRVCRPVSSLRLNIGFCRICRHLRPLSLRHPWLMTVLFSL